MIDDETVFDRILAEVKAAAAEVRRNRDAVERRTTMLVASGVLGVLGFLVGVLGAVALWINHVDDRREDEQRVEIDYSICLNTQVNREVIRSVVTEAYRPSGGLPLTTPPEFAALDPSTQAYLAAIEARSSSPEGTAAAEARRDAVLAQIPPLECVPP